MESTDPMKSELWILKTHFQSLCLDKVKHLFNIVLLSLVTQVPQYKLQFLKLLNMYVRRLLLAVMPQNGVELKKILEFHQMTQVAH